MPRTKYIGKTIPQTQEHNYLETRISFRDYMNNTKKDLIKKPTAQCPLDIERINSMVEEYLSKPTYFHCKDKILIGDLNNHWFIMDGQHRLEAIKNLYEEHNKWEDNHKFTFCWFKVRSHTELEELFVSLNKDSAKNEYYVSKDITERIKLNSFQEEFSKLYKKYFNKTKSTAKNSRIYSIEEFREILIKKGFFDKYQNEDINKLIDIIRKSNDEFYLKNRYTVELETNGGLFYQDEISKLENKVVFSLKKCNFLEFLMDNGVEPRHEKRIFKKTIGQKLRKQVWDKEFPNKEYGICPIPDCNQTIYRNVKNGWHAGHVISEKNGGKTALCNLRPICATCNQDMGTEDWIPYCEEITKNTGH